jgi:hypothetical protein
MRKRHAPSQVHHMTMCGHEATPWEYAKMKTRDKKYINCKKCKELLK